MTSTSVLLITGWIAGWWLLWRVPRLDSSERARVDTAEFAVVIPARDEARNLPGLLEDLAKQRPCPSELVVVDDESSDATAAVAQRHGATVVRGEPLPPGWTGKTWGCHQGARATTARRLVFVDADVRLRRHALAALLGRHDRVGGLLSVAPYHRMHGVVERASTLFNVVSFMGVGAARFGRRANADGAFGPCMVTWRVDYDDVGGHAAVRESVVEDVALAKCYDERELPNTVEAGTCLVEYRMYPDGIGQLVEGWSKNFAGGARAVPVGRSLLVALWITALLVASQVVGLALVGSPRHAPLEVGLAYGAFAVQQWRFARALTNAGPLTALLFPVTTAIFVLIFVRSLWLTFVRRRVRWRHRTIELRAPESSIGT
jgi:4,4'-diaponeurosporenoate glycosyltransferase